MTSPDCVECNICRSRSHDLSMGGSFRAKGECWVYSLYGCPACGHAQLEPVPSEKVLDALYAGYQTESAVGAAESLSGRLKNKLGALAAIKHIHGYPVRAAIARPFVLGLEMATTTSVPLSTSVPCSLHGNTPMLDFGCGSGLWLLRMKALGFSDLSGYDLDNPFMPELMEKGISIFSGNGLCNVDRKFGAIRIHHVLEHMRDPRSTLLQLFGRLESNGHLLIGVPNYGSPSARSLGPKWANLALPHHINHFTERSLCALLEQCGFSIVAMQERPIYEIARPALSPRLRAIVPDRILRYFYYLSARSHAEGENMECWARRADGAAA